MRERARTRGVDAVRAALGAQALLLPAMVLAGVARPRPAEIAVVRVLGARQLVQAAVLRRSGLRALGAGVDLLHALSMAPLAAAAPRRLGRAAALQALTAVLLAVCELRADDRR